MPLLEIQVDRDRNHLHLLNRPAETHFLRAYSRQEWGSCEGVFGQSFPWSPASAALKSSPSPLLVPAHASRNTNRFGDFSNKEAAALRQTGWGMGEDC